MRWFVLNNQVIITLMISRDDFSDMVREIVEYVIDVVREKYGLNIVYRRIVSDKYDAPYLVINDLDPIIIDELPSVELLTRMILMTLDTGVWGRGNNSSAVGNSVSDDQYGF